MLSSLFAQNEIEGRWHLVGYEDAIMYQFVDTEPFADAGLRYSIYVDENGEFDDLDGDNIGGTPHPYSVAGDIITIPKNTWHGVTINSKDAMKVISIQSPKFLGNDRVFKN